MFANGFHNAGFDLMAPILSTAGAVRGARAAGGPGCPVLSAEDGGWPPSGGRLRGRALPLTWWRLAGPVPGNLAAYAEGGEGDPSGAWAASAAASA